MPATPGPDPWLRPSSWGATESALPAMMYADAVRYLPDDVLVKVDRTAMAVSLETRAPLLDHAVMEFAWRLPLGLKVHGGRGKHLLRRLLDRYVPRALVDRPKMGFAVPLEHWLRGPLREWADALLAPERLAREGYFNPAVIRACWADHQAGRYDRHFLLWDVLMFQAWLEAQGSGRPG